MSCHLSIGRVGLVSAIALGVAVLPASAGIPIALPFTGVETSATSGQTGTTTGGTFLSATVTGTYGGGEGIDYDTRSYDIGEGAAFTEADHDGNTSGIVATPTLRSSSTGATLSSGSQAYAGVITPYQYNGAAPGLVTFNWGLTADLFEPDPATTAAFVRGRGGIVVDPEFFETRINQYYESSSFPEDTFDSSQNSGGVLNDSGSISFTADPGQVFHLVMNLVTQAGHTGAYADASSTLTGTFSSPGGSITLVGGVGPLIGDLDSDGFVGITDLNVVLGNWNASVTAGDLTMGDPSNDGFVGIEDLNVVLGNWNAGTAPPSAVVPEPASLVLLGLGGLAVLRRRA